MVSYAPFVAPGMLAASAFNGALFDSTFNVFFKLRFTKLYDQMLATPLCPPTSRSARSPGGCGAASTPRPSCRMARWGCCTRGGRCCPAGGGVHRLRVRRGGHGATTYMKSWQDFDMITLAQLPMFLFSPRSSPSRRTPALRWVVEVTPLYPGVVLCRELTTARSPWPPLVSVVYLLAMGGRRGARCTPAGWTRCC